MRVKKRRSAVAGRFKVDAPLLLVIVLFGLAVGAFVYREIRKNPFGLQTDIYPIHISATNVKGVGFGSQLRCQGFVVGRVREVRPKTDGSLAFTIEARIDSAYSRWKFDTVAAVQPNVGPTYLGLSTIELTYKGTFPAPREQHLVLRHEEGPNYASMQADAPKIVADLKEIVSSLNKPPAELAKLDPKTATAVQRMILNAHDTSDRMNRASIALTEAEGGSPSPIQRIQETVKDLQQAGRDLRQASAKSVQLEAQLAHEVDSLSREMHLRLANIEYSAFQILGETPAERKALGRDVRETFANMRSASAEVDDLIPRIGDTFLGRLFIRRDKKKPPARKVKIVRRVVATNNVVPVKKHTVPVTKNVAPVKKDEYRDQRDGK